MRLRHVTLTLMVLLAGCGDDQKSAKGPPPAQLTASAIGHYCGMALVEHPGPKGQIFIGTQGQPFWFSSARDTVAFTLLPEEPKDIRGIYVTDMGKAKEWNQPGQETWMDARQAFYVVGSRAKGGMGQAELVPFGDRAKADEFAKSNGGRVVAWAEIPKDYVLASDTPAVVGGQQQGMPASDPADKEHQQDMGMEHQRGHPSTK